MSVTGFHGPAVWNVVFSPGRVSVLRTSCARSNRAEKRRSAVIEQLVSLMLQGAVVMLIISLTGIIAKEIGATTFFSDSSFKDVVIKAL